MFQRQQCQYILYYGHLMYFSWANNFRVLKILLLRYLNVGWYSLVSSTGKVTGKLKIHHSKTSFNICQDCQLGLKLLNIYISKYCLQNVDLIMAPMSACIPIGSVGWKPTSFTDPACPGNLYSIRRDVVSQMYRYLSPEPADILLPSGDQAHLNRFCNEVYSCSFKF